MAYELLASEIVQIETKECESTVSYRIHGRIDAALGERYGDSERL